MPEPRYVVDTLGTYYVVRDTVTDLAVATRTDVFKAQEDADRRNHLEALDVQAGDTVTGTTTGGHPRLITVTVDRAPWIVGDSGGVALTDGGSMDLVELASLIVHPRPAAGSLIYNLDRAEELAARHAGAVTELEPVANEAGVLVGWTFRLVASPLRHGWVLTDGRVSPAWETYRLGDVPLRRGGLRPGHRRQLTPPHPEPTERTD